MISLNYLTLELFFNFTFFPRFPSDPTDANNNSETSLSRGLFVCVRISFPRHALGKLAGCAGIRMRPTLIAAAAEKLGGQDPVGAPAADLWRRRSVLTPRRMDRVGSRNEDERGWRRQGWWWERWGWVGGAAGSGDDKVHAEDEHVAR